MISFPFLLAPIGLIALFVADFIFFAQQGFSFFDERVNAAHILLWNALPWIGLILACQQKHSVSKTISLILLTPFLILTAFITYGLRNEFVRTFVKSDLTKVTYLAMNRRGWNYSARSYKFEYKDRIDVYREKPVFPGVVIEQWLSSNKDASDVLIRFPSDDKVVCIYSSSDGQSVETDKFNTCESGRKLEESRVILQLRK